MSGIPAGAGSLLGKRLGKYEILALLALGGTAEIYLARIGGAAGFEKWVVVKCLHDHLADDTEFVKMFLDEARLAAYLDHSNIVQTMELGEYENRYYMAMEFLAGLSLAMIVRRAGERLPGGKIPVPLVLNMVAQSCAGLHYAHERTANGKPLNIVHRDISPQNLVVSFEGVVKIVDFGIAKAEMRETRTRSGTIKGKFAYMSPEQCVANNVDRRTDVFALGVIAHELLTGRRLFKKASPYETYQAVLDCNVEPPSKLNRELDPQLDAIIMRAVAKEKEQRYPTAEAFGDAIIGYLHHRGKGSGPGDVARWFEQHFNQEIDEHGARMRELISAGSFSVDTGVKWDKDEEEAAAALAAADRRSETVDIVRGKVSALSLDTGDVELGRGSSGQISGVADLDLDDPPPDDDEIPAERTRIEANPMEKVNELERIANTPKPVRKTPAPENAPTVLGSAGQSSGGLYAPLNPPATATGAERLPPPPSGPVSATPPGGTSRFAGTSPSQVPTVIHPDNNPVELAKTEVASDKMIDPHARTNLDMTPPTLNDGRRVLAGPAPNMGPGPAPGMQQQPHPPQPSQPPPMRPNPISHPPPMGPFGYPVVDKQMSQQILQGATVFPSDHRGSGNIHRGPDSDPMRVASPVGQHFQGDVDWAAAATAPARAVPPWMLAVLFVAALGIALGVTMLIAVIVR
jgi:eukaryotic-like serine/threonine-protein kinase